MWLSALPPIGTFYYQWIQDANEEIQLLLRCIEGGEQPNFFVFLVFVDDARDVSNLPSLLPKTNQRYLEAVPMNDEKNIREHQ